jgi:NAD(P)H dehydrogenase (quinone)
MQEIWRSVPPLQAKNQKTHRPCLLAFISKLILSYSEGNLMHVLTVYAHPNPKSFCHAVLQEFTKGLIDAGHTSEVVDLYGIRFDPVFRIQDFASYVNESMPLDILDQMNLKQQVLDSAGGPIQRLIASRWIRNMNSQAVAKFIHDHRPKDVIEQWEKLSNADGLAFISPVFWLHFPAILKGWFERVFTYGDAYALTPDGWRGEVSGRVPLLHHEKALVINTTLFKEEYYKADWEAPMTRIIDDWGLRYPGVKKVEHVYFYNVPISDDQTRKHYLERAYLLGKEF